MMTLLIVLSIVLLVLIVGTVRVVKGDKKNRYIEWNDRKSFIRIWPNPGWTINGRHWCRAKKARGH